MTYIKSIYISDRSAEPAVLSGRVLWGSVAANGYGE